MLKKIAIVAAVVVLLEGMACAALTSFTDITSTELSSPSTGQVGLAFKPSNNVKMFYKADLASRAQNYVIVAKHTSGTYTVFTSNMATGIYYKADTTVKDGVALTSSNIPDSSTLTAGYSTAPSGWTGL